MSKHASPSLASFMRSAELGSFAAASKALGISPAAVGQNVKRMEDDYGVKLFNRTTRKMSLTPEGALLFQRARAPLKALDEVDHLFAEARGLVTGPLRISAPKHLAYKTLTPLVADFCAAHPQVEIEIDASDNVRDLVDDPVDVAFRIGAPDDSTMIARPLSSLPVFTLAAPSYLKKRGIPTHPQDLADHECVQYRFPTSNNLWTWAFTIDGEIIRQETKGKFVFNDPETIMAASVAGLGLCQMDAAYSKEFVDQKKLQVVMGPFAADMFSLNLCYASRENLTLRVRAFIDFILTRMKNDCYAMPEWRK